MFADFFPVQLPIVQLTHILRLAGGLLKRSLQRHSENKLVRLSYAFFRHSICHTTHPFFVDPIITHPSARSPAEPKSFYAS